MVRKVLATVLLVMLVSSCNTKDYAMMDIYWVNQQREARHLVALQWDDVAAAKAQAWSEHVASIGSLTHSVLEDGITDTWTFIGENIGSGEDLHDIHEGLMNSPKHRAAILNPNYRKVGVGVTKIENLYYVVEVYVTYKQG